MKSLLYSILTIGVLFSCNTSKKISQNRTRPEKELSKVNNDSVIIVNEVLEYKIVIIEPGFNSWSSSKANQRGFYTQQFLEVKNRFYVNEWNRRVLEPQRFNPNLYALKIDYQNGIDYGYEVNYMLYNYFIYFQLTYNQRLGPFVPRI